jgi:hypothetical protein
MEQNKFIYESPDGGKTIFKRKMGKIEREIVSKEDYETCVMCGTSTNVPVSTHIDYRYGYVEGVGQCCKQCYTGENKDSFRVSEQLVLDTPNDVELGAKIRALYWKIKKMIYGV